LLNGMSCLLSMLLLLLFSDDVSGSVFISELMTGYYLLRFDAVSCRPDSCDCLGLLNQA
jgi:hypothetical protein